MAKKRISPEAKRIQKRDVLLQRLSEITERSQETLLQQLGTPLQTSVRINPLRADVAQTIKTMEALGWHGEPVPWAPNCFTITEGYEVLRDSDLHHSGAIYFQNSSSWLPVIALAPEAGQTILDVCAAPGGKTSHIAAVTHNQAHITTNDNSRPRLIRLQQNLERLGASAEYTLRDAQYLTKALRPASFDTILLDAPCSGEGLISPDKLADFDTWSEAHIKRLSMLQKRILQQAWHLLKPGRSLVYSTCTSAPEENEQVVQWLLGRNDDAELVAIPELQDVTEPALTTWRHNTFHADMVKARRILPNLDGRELFFVAKLRKIPSNTPAVD